MIALRTPLTFAALALLVGSRSSAAQGSITIGGVGKMIMSSDTAVKSDTTQVQDLVATIQRAGNYNTFARLLTLANLASTLQGSAPFTVFAPTDAAFEGLPKGMLDSLQADSAKLKKVLLYHLVSGAIPASKILNLRNGRTLEGSTVDFSVQNSRLMVNKAMIIQPDMKASNGLIEGIDGVLMPPKK